MKLVVIVLLCFAIYMGLGNAMSPSKLKLTPKEMSQPISLKISPYKDNILYKSGGSDNWHILLKASQLNYNILNFFSLWRHARIFTQITATPDRNKILISVCNNTIPEDDNADHWILIYDLRHGNRKEIPGNNVIGFSANHKLIFTSFINDGSAETTNRYVIDLATDEVLLSQDLQTHVNSFYPDRPESSLLRVDEISTDDPAARVTIEGTSIRRSAFPTPMEM